VKRSAKILISAGAGFVLLTAGTLRAKAPVGQAGRGHWAATGLVDTDLEGPVCESTDSFGRHALPPLDRGDLIAIELAGTYSASFTSRYNGRPRPPLYCCGSMARCSHAKGHPSPRCSHSDARTVQRGEASPAGGLPHRGFRHGH
jgi:hypothetical protein